MRRNALTHSSLTREAVRAVLLVLLLALPALAQSPQQQLPPSQASQTGAQDGAAQRTLRVARISLLEGDVNYQRGDDKNTDWFDATINTALEERDQLYSGRNGRAEMQLNGRTLVRIDRETNLRITQFNTSTVQLSQSIGTATFRVDNLDRRQFNVYDVSQGSIDDPLYFEVDTPSVAITFTKEGVYRINVREDGTTELIVRKGQAEVYNQELGTIPVKSGRRILIEGRDVGYYQIAKLNDKDEWDRWNDRRDDDFYARDNSYRSNRYVPASIAGVYDLDNYGDWIDTPEYGQVWAPRGVNAGWAPYRSGHWRYHNTWGWTWTSYEPWGWAPYHYGRWTYWRSRWCWTPNINIGIGRVGIGFWDWSPHLVAFFGSGGGYNRGYRDGYWDGARDARYSWTGWCPLGIGERWGNGYYDRGGYGRNYGGRTVINNTTIINNTTVVRSIDSLRNYGSPNGVSGMDGRRFDQRRVVVDNVTAPPRGTGRQLADASPRNPNGGRGLQNQPVLELARPEVLRPTQNEIVRALPVERNSATARALVAPVVARRAPTYEGERTMPTRNGLENGVPARTVEGVQGNRPTARSTENGEVFNAPARNTESPKADVFNRPERRSSSNNSNNSNGDFRPVERVERPTVTRPATEDRRVTMPERNSNNGNNNGGYNRSSSDNGTVFTPPRDRNMPTSRDNRDMPARSQERPERVEAPRQIERRESSRPPERVIETPRPERSAPPRESMPSRAPERVERSAPPPRESAPARPERSSESRREMPARKPDNR